VSRYRLIADSGSGLTLQRLGSAAGSTWQTIRTGLPNKAAFSRLNNVSLQVYRSDGTSTRYYGSLSAVRVSATGTAGGVRTVDRVTYDKYAMGVTPREMPASWQHAGVQAQAIAARTYGDYEVHHPPSSYYDICDTSSCQVYGGHAHYDSHGNTLWIDDQPVAKETTNLVLHYQHTPVFAQYSASNGGWTVAGSQPYLPAKADGYDSSKSGDPYLNATKTVSVATLAKHFGLAKATKIAITKRDGHGSWGGRVLSGYLSGTTSTGAAKTVNFDGFDLQAAFGLGTTLLQVQAA
jgi:SpoIID/LytB domain protein